MDELAEIGRWIAENESLLSGMAAIVVLVGVVFSPLGGGLRSLLGRREPNSRSHATHVCPSDISVGCVSTPRSAKSLVRYG